MTRKEERLAYRKENGFMIDDLRDKLSEYFEIYEYYGLSRCNPHEIKLLDKVTGKDTDFTIIMKSYSEDYFATDITIQWYKSWYTNEQAWKKIEWLTHQENIDLYDYFVVNHYIGYREVIKKENIIDFILDFIVELGNDNLTVSLKRDRKLKTLLPNI